MTTDTLRFIYFDLDDTLLDHRYAERHGLADLIIEFADYFGHLAPDHVQTVYHQHNGPLWHQYALGNIGRDDLKRLRFERMLASLGIDGLDAHQLNDRYLTCYARHWILPDEAHQAFHTIADHYPVGLLTNGFSEIQQAKLERFPSLRARAKTIIISEDIGAMKPNPQIFAHAAAVAGVTADSLLYIGDSLRSDIYGALNAGWRAAWYTPAEAHAETPNGVFRFAVWEELTSWLLD